MGIYNRDYYRESGSGANALGFDGSSAVHQLFIFTIVVYILQILITVPGGNWREYLMELPTEEREFLLEREKSGRQREVQLYVEKQFNIPHVSLLEEWGAVSPAKVLQGQVWRLLTYAFLHDRGSPWHIIFNMMVLWMFGPAVEELRGRREFFAFYLLGAIISGLAHVLFGLATNTPNGAVGASGALMAVSMLFAMRYPHYPISLFFLITLEARWLMLLYLAWDLFPVLQALGGQGSPSRGVAHAAHLGGLAFGFLYDKNHWTLTDWLAPRNAQSRLRGGLWGWLTRPRMRVYREPVAPPSVPAKPRKTVNLEQRVDEILKKIKDEGESSLTDQERNILREASRTYRDRNSL